MRYRSWFWWELTKTAGVQGKICIWGVFPHPPMDNLLSHRCDCAKWHHLVPICNGWNHCELTGQSVWVWLLLFSFPQGGVRTTRTFFPWKEAGSLTIHPGVLLGIRQWWDYWHHVPTYQPLLPLSGAISLTVGECSSLKREVFMVCLSLKPFRPEIFQNKVA